jgi:hypothetical protein
MHSIARTKYILHLVLASTSRAMLISLEFDWAHVPVSSDVVSSSSRTDGLDEGAYEALTVGVSLPVCVRAEW